MQVNPYLSFKGQCEAAFRFYEQCFGGQLGPIFRYTGTSLSSQVPPDWQDKVMHGSVMVGGHELMGADVAPESYEEPKGFSLSVQIKSTAEAERIFRELSADGRVVMPLEKTFWAERFGMVVNRFGVPSVDQLRRTRPARVTNSDYREIRLHDGRILAYAEYGGPRGLPIVHCHGTPSSRVEGNLIFNAAVAAELGVRIIVPDRPGMGRSDFQPGRRIVDWPEDVLQLAEALGLDTFAVLGSSGGSPYAAACGALIPNRVRLVGLLGGVGPADRPRHRAGDERAPPDDDPAPRYAPAVLRGLFRLNLEGDARRWRTRRRTHGRVVSRARPDPAAA